MYSKNNIELQILHNINMNWFWRTLKVSKFSNYLKWSNTKSTSQIMLGFFLKCKEAFTIFLVQFLFVLFLEKIKFGKRVGQTYNYCTYTLCTSDQTWVIHAYPARILMQLYLTVFGLFLKLRHFSTLPT